MSTTQTTPEYSDFPDKGAFMAAGPLGCPIDPAGVAPLWRVCRDIAHRVRTHISVRRRRSL